MEFQRRVELGREVGKGSYVLCSGASGTDAVAARYGFVATPTALSGSKPNTGAAQAYVGSLRSITTEGSLPL